MALRLSINTPHGITLPLAYVRIVSYSGDNDNILFTTITHADVAARNNNDVQIESNSYSFSAPDAIPTGGLVSYGYGQIKALPEFVGAVDV